MEEKSEQTGEMSLGEKAGRAVLQKISEFLEQDRLGELNALEERAALKNASDEDFTAYDRFFQLFNWSMVRLSRTHIELEKLFWSLDALYGLANSAFAGEAFNSFICQLPEIMTGREFVETRKAAREEYFTEGGSEVMLSVYDIITMATDYYLRELEKEPDHETNPMNVIKRWYTEETVKSAHILNNWNRVHKNGYFTREGKNSDIMTREAFDAFLENERHGELCDVIANHMAEDFPDFEEKLNEEPGSANRIEWHDLTTPVSGLTKWEAIRSLAKLYDEAPDLQDMANEFPELVTGLTARIKQKNGLDISKIPVEKWREPFISRRELYKIGFGRVRFFGDVGYLCNKRNGVAILAGSWEMQIRGNFKRPRVDIYREQTLEGYIEDRGGARIKEIRHHTDQLFKSLYHIKGHNCAMALISEVHGLPGFARFIVELEDAVFNKMEALNCVVEELFSAVKELPPSETLRNAKLQAIKDFFLFPRLDDVRIPQKNIDKARRMVKDLSAFSERSEEFSRLLLEWPPEQPQQPEEPKQ